MLSFCSDPESVCTWFTVVISFRCFVAILPLAVPRYNHLDLLAECSGMFILLRANQWVGLHLAPRTRSVGPKLYGCIFWVAINFHKAANQVGSSWRATSFVT